MFVSLDRQQSEQNICGYAKSGMSKHCYGFFIENELPICFSIVSITKLADFRFFYGVIGHILILY